MRGDRVSTGNGVKLLVFFGMALMMMAMGLWLSPSIADLLSGYRVVITHPSLLNFDALKQAGHFGTGFFNAGLLLAISLALFYVTGTDVQGVQIAAAMMVAGFSFYGKNPVNIWFPMLGVFLHAKAMGKPLRSVTALSLFATGVSPIFSVLAYGTPSLGQGSLLAIVVGALFGIVAGAIIDALAGYLPTLHGGYSLYNAGFAAGIAAMLVNAAQKALAIGHDKFAYSDADYVSGANAQLFMLLMILFAYLVVCGFLLGGGKGFGKLILLHVRGGDFVSEHGFGNVLLNMGMLGTLVTVYAVATGGQLCGPLFASILTVAGFAAAGVSFGMCAPIIAGVWAGAFLTGGIGSLVLHNSFLSGAFSNVSSLGMLLAAMFCVGASPVVGKHGALPGFIVGIAHAVVVTNTSALHGYMSLYNNGFCLSLLITFLQPSFIWLQQHSLHIGHGKKQTAHASAVR